jgi:hypothetical protein
MVRRQPRHDVVVEPMTPGEAVRQSTADPTVDWRVVLRGSLVGLAIIVPVTVLRVVLDREVRDFDDSGWIYPLFVLILIGYMVAGWVGGRARPDTPLMHGSLAGIGVLVLWIPARIVIWAVREDGRGLVSGDKAALRPGQVFGAFVIAAALSMFGGWLGARVRVRRADATPAPTE